MGKKKNEVKDSGVLSRLASLRRDSARCRGEKSETLAIREMKRWRSDLILLRTYTFFVFSHNVFGYYFKCEP